MTPSLVEKQCISGKAGNPRLTDIDAIALSKQLHEEWQLDKSAKTLTRRFEFKGFAKASYMTNLCVWLADREGHHPDLSLGFGYCQVTLTTHDVGGLSENDFIWAAKLDQIID